MIQMMRFLAALLFLMVNQIQIMRFLAALLFARNDRLIAIKERGEEEAGFARLFFPPLLLKLTNLSFRASPKGCCEESHRME